MRNLFFILTTVLISMYSWGGGGVDVGNHSPKMFQGTLKLPYYKSEEEMVSYAQKILPAIESGQLTEVRNLIKAGHCSDQGIKFDLLEVITEYEVDQKLWRLQRLYSGIITFQLRDCKKTRNIQI